MKPDFKKGNGLVPVIIQHAQSQQVLMLGYMNAEAFEKTKLEGKVTFFSRSKNRLWTKGESSGNFLFVKKIQLDCDQDTLLIKALPKGPTCHTGKYSCFGKESEKGFLHKLAATIQDRKKNPQKGSYTNKLFNKGLNKIAQKVGEEAVELVIEAKDNNDQLFLDEAADLMYHFLVLLAQKGKDLSDVEKVLLERHE